MDTLRLINLGYLSYVNFLINDMESMREYLTKSQSIMIESLSVRNRSLCRVINAWRR